MSESIKKRKLYISAAAILIAVAVSAAIAGFGRSSSSEATNDAYVTADYTVVAPRVAGQITGLLVEDNQVVHQGQLLAQIDDRDYRAAVASAQANVAMAKAAIDNASTSIVQQQSVIEQANAALAAARASYTFARADYSRYTDLASRGAGSVQNAQQAQSRIDTAQADVARSQAAVQAARQQVAVLQSVRDRAQAALEQASATLDTARLNLSWTHIVAPVDGMVGQRSVRLGAYVTAGTPLLAVVPLQRAYVVANFQETQLTSVRRGQPADIRVDTFPGAVLHGTVDSLAPATGVTFAPIAPDNATGNFTKIVQRIPVKILLRPGQPELERLRVGMSVETTIRTDDSDARGKTGGILK
ncbi:membrane fusion protein (multidrug efflux system) [Paraburkholderia tropica]|uniref:Membrane fusion protein (Multidrug efflux system) n=1 Tax=Paraburkholderia tropica TaxID=92647 RepID=A0ABX5MGW5_9BURK|nr:HlyD family secretion protein [Paraburkholderia tropica]PXX08583.1 membrane fusion protein (multidrug efflux system) [Paraburkholderia tropica]PZW73881.1 membrane fusion protein (multidrug efflux system) [Paraburkholderia tropica]